MTDVFSAGHRQQNVWIWRGIIWLQRFGWTNKMCTCYVFITWQREVTSVINRHNVLKSDTVDDHSHYTQYTEKGDKTGNTICISQCTWRWTEQLFLYLDNVSSKQTHLPEVLSCKICMKTSYWYSWETTTRTCKKAISFGDKIRWSRGKHLPPPFSHS